MRRNPLLYSDPSEIEEIPKPAPITSKEPTGKSSFFFYFIILANSLLVLFVLGFIWFLFLKSPDIQIKEISNRLFGTGAPTEQQAQQTIAAPQIQTEVVVSPTQQEKDETQQAKLKQMREKEELAAERARLEAIKAEITIEKLRASEAKQAIESMQVQTDNSNVAGISAEQAVEIEQTKVEDLTANPTERSAGSPEDAKNSRPEETGQAVDAPNTASEPNANSTSSQMNLILETLKNQQANPANSN